MRYPYSLLIRIALLFTIQIKFLFFIFYPLTVYPVFFFFKLLHYDPALKNTLMIIRGVPLEFISACIAPSAYYLILVLILLTKDINVIDVPARQRLNPQFKHNQDYYPTPYLI